MSVKALLAFLAIVMLVLGTDSVAAQGRKPIKSAAPSIGNLLLP